MATRFVEIEPEYLNLVVKKILQEKIKDKHEFLGIDTRTRSNGAMYYRVLIASKDWGDFGNKPFLHIKGFTQGTPSEEFKESRKIGKAVEKSEEEIREENLRQARESAISEAIIKKQAKKPKKVKKVKKIKK